MKSLRCLLLLMAGLLAGRAASAHPMPASVVLLDVGPAGLACELMLPLKELQLAVPRDVTTHPEALLQRDSAFLCRYIGQHLHAVSPAGMPWTVHLNRLAMHRTEQRETGVYYELVAYLRLVPPAGGSPRRLQLYYDGIMHAVPSHKILVAVRQDWDRGQLARSEEQWETAGVMAFDARTGGVAPLAINLETGSRWRGFKALFLLGTEHIAEGTDHLLFLLVLLLPAPLLAAGGRWLGAGGARYSTIRLLKIVTAFTAGHSLTLLAGAVGWVRLPGTPVEVFIALSILVGAVHALRPLFPGREALVAAGFGLVHGLAFAATLYDLHLEGGRLALSILGFNLGIEAAQLFVVLMVVPWLVILSGAKGYRYLRIGGATLAGIAGLAWMAERLSGRPNAVTELVAAAAVQARWGVLLLAVAAAWVGVRGRQKTPTQTN